MTNTKLAEALHRYGLADWVRRADRDEMLRVAQACVNALDEIQRLERENAQLASLGGAALTQLHAAVEPKRDHPTTDPATAYSPQRTPQDIVNAMTDDEQRALWRSLNPYGDVW